MRPDDKILFFIALIPPSALRDRIRSVKERISHAYNSGHALKSPAHITLQMPFKRASADVKDISNVLRKFASAEKPFRVDLIGYGAFAPRVIFIKIVEPDPVQGLHSRLKRVLIDELHFHHDEVMRSVQPHITVATRDLTKAAFGEAWAEFEDEEFSASFEAGSLFLLKHNGRSWDILEEFPFGRQ